MKLVVAYVHLHPKTVEAVWDSVDELDDVRWCDTSSDESAYYRLLCDLWGEGETFVILEQDKIPDQRALRDLYDCDSPWCSYPHLMADGAEIPITQPTLGCTKFGADVMAKWPDLVERSGRLNVGLGAQHWGRLDMAITAGLTWAVGSCHVHEFGRITHDHQGA